MNLAVISGKVYGDPNKRPVNRTSVTQVSVMVTEGKYDYLFSVEGWGDTSNLLDTFQKDDEISVVGKLIKSSWEDKKTGEKKSIVRIRASQVQKGSLPSFDTAPQEERQPVAAASAPAPAATSDDDIPF